MTTFFQRTFQPLPQAAAPLRAKHRDALRRLSEWSLGAGRPIDTDVAAICIDAFEDYLRDYSRGTGVLTRPLVNAIQWSAIHNEATMLNVVLPDDWPVHFWTLLCWYAATDQLAPNSDPLNALLEPLQCYGGLDADGFPRPDGEDVAFVCQCYVPYDPNLPVGQTSLIIGHDSATGDARLIHVHPQHRSDDPLFSAYTPLLQLAKRSGRKTLDVKIDPLEWKFLGRADPTKHAPEVWLYHRTSRRHQNPIILDATGIGWTPHPDQRRKLGYRLRRVSLVGTLGWAAAAEDECDEEPEWFDQAEW